MLGGTILRPADQLRILTRIWGPQRDGYVFLPWISGSCKTSEERKKQYHEGRAYEWPRERGAILKYLQSHPNDDIYFCPTIFNGKRRIEELADAEKTLWADLDEVNPHHLTSYKPTIAWESSPGRYQAVWLLDRMRHGASWPGKENQRLTYALNADPSGWDTTQLLRVPGRKNYKPEYKKANNHRPVQGRLLWENGPRFVWEDFNDLPEIGIISGEDYDLLDEEFLQGIDRHKVWSRVRLRVSPLIRQYMSVRHPDEVSGTDRSDVLWQIERELADAGCTLAEIVAIIRPSVWNKFTGRSDELKRLKTEAAKALHAVKETGGALEIVETPRPENVLWLHQVGQQKIQKPRWLIKDIWTEGACGFIAGAPKSYKSFIALDLAISIATGQPFLHHNLYKSKKEKVLYLQEEDSLSLVLQRTDPILRSKADKAHWHGYLTYSPHRQLLWSPPEELPLAMHVRTGFMANDEAWQSWLDETIDQNKFKVVIIDTLSTTAGNIDIDKSQELMTKILKPMRELANKHNCSIIIVHHNRKDSKDERAGRDMLGSVALHAWVDCALYIRSKQEIPNLATKLYDENLTLITTPGYQLFIQRESKFAEDLSFKLNIPKITPETLWHPQIISTNDSTQTDIIKTPNNKLGGSQIVNRMKAMGITSERGITLQQLAERENRQPRSLKTQLNNALKNNLLTLTNDTYYLSN